MGFGSSSNVPAGSETSKLSALKVQTAGFGVAIQIPYGTVRLSPTLGYHRDFTAHAHKEGNGGGGGKGGGGGGGGSTYYTYTVAALFFFCQGQIRDVGRVWRDKKRYETMAAAGFSTHRIGTTSQTEWDYVVTHYPAEALNYRRLAYVAASALDLGRDGHLGNHAFEIMGHCLSGVTTDQNTVDAHIKDIIQDFLTHPIHGAVDSRTVTITLALDRLHAYCVARGILISPLVSEQRPAHEYLSEWAKVANAGIVWSEGQLKFLPYCDVAVTGSFGSYTPETTIRYTFDADNVLEPIKPQRKKPSDCFNVVPIEYMARGRAYNKANYDAKDLGSISLDGLRKAPTLVFDCIRTTKVAIITAYTALQRGLYIRNTYTIKTAIDAETDLLEPMDFIYLNDTALGLSNFRARITSMSDAQGGELTIVAEEAPEGVYHG